MDLWAWGLLAHSLARCPLVLTGSGLQRGQTAPYLGTPEPGGASQLSHPREQAR